MVGAAVVEATVVCEAVVVCEVCIRYIEKYQLIKLMLIFVTTNFSNTRH